MLTGLATLTGPLHGAAVCGIVELREAARSSGAGAAVRAWLAGGRRLPGFGHPLYGDGDPRARSLLAHLEPSADFVDLATAGRELAGEEPNIDFALAALADVYGLPPGAPLSLFAVARSVGWLAHAMEQNATGALIRPRARYIGPSVGA
jgi:citrate synthase